MKILLYLSIFASTLGSEAVGVSISGFNLSPFRAFVLLSAILYIVKTFYNKNNTIIAKGKTAYSFKFMYFWTIYAVITGLWARDKILWMKSCYFLITATVLLVLLINIIESKEDILNCFKSFTIGILLQCIIGWTEIITGNYRYADQGYGYAQMYKALKLPVAMWFNVNDFATVLSAGIVAAFISFFLSKNKVERIFYMIVLINISVLLFRTQSRANIIGVLIMIVFILLVYNKAKWIIIPVIIGVAVYIPNISNHLLFIFNSDISTVRSDQMRLTLIKDGLGFLVDTLGFGVGAGQVSVWSVMKRQSLGGAIHNWWIEILVSYGVVIWIAYLVHYFKLLKINFNAIRNHGDEYDKTIAPALCAFLIGFVLCSISSSTLSNNEVIWTFFNIIIVYSSYSGIRSKAATLL